MSKNHCISNIKLGDKLTLNCNVELIGYTDLEFVGEVVDFYKEFPVVGTNYEQTLRPPEYNFGTIKCEQLKKIGYRFFGILYPHHFIISRIKKCKK